ncbi:hypothetical protein [Streptacidiphilus sp. PAMC 29251]
MAISPILLVAWDSAVSRVSGSSWPGGRARLHQEGVEVEPAWRAHQSTLELS